MKEAVKGHFLAIIGGICLISLTIPSTMYLWKLQENQGAVQREIAEQIKQTRLAVLDWMSVNLIPPVNKMTATIDRVPDIAGGTVHVELSAIREMAQQEIRHAVDTSAGEIRVAILAAETTEKDVIKEVQGIRTDLRPVLDNSAVLVNSANNYLNSDDMQALLGSSVVAVTQASQVAQTFNAEFPKLIKTSEVTNEQVAGIATDFHSITTGLDQKYVHPPKKGFWGKVGAGLNLVKDLAIAALRGGAL